MEWSTILVAVLTLVVLELIPARWRDKLRSVPEHLGRRLSYSRLMLVWVVTPAVMFFGWHLGTQTPNTWLAILLFIGAPVAALVLTSWAQDARGRL